MRQVTDRTDHTTDQIEKFIKFYRSQNLNIIPIRYRDKVPIGEWKRYQSEVVSEEEIQRIFLSGAAVNLGVVCGAISGNLVVIDFDDRSTYRKYFSWAEKETFVVETGKGVHVYFKTDYPVRGFKIQELNIDVKGEGGYIVAPPSIHPSGREYRALSNLPITSWSGDFKQELYERLKIKGEPEEVDINKLLDGVDEGERDETAIRVATWYRGQGLTEEQAARTLKEWNRKNRPPLDEQQLLKCVKSAFKPKEPYAYNFKAMELKQELTSEIESFLRDPNLHQNIRDILDFRIFGESNLKMLYYYISIGAAITKTPFGVIVVDVLGTGKSYGQRELLKVLPSERVDQPTSISDRVVNYLGSRFQGRIVRIDEIYKKASEEKEEDQGLPYIRMWMSEGRLEHWVTDPETRKEIKIVSDGCPLFLTSTTYEVGEQYGSRNYIAHVDTSQEQTKGIHRQQATFDAIPEVLFEHERKQMMLLTQVSRWLMQNPKEVLIPFDFSFPSAEPRQRRERPKFTHLVKCVANVHQLQRKEGEIEGIKHIVAEPRDFEIAMVVYRDFLKSSMSTLDKYDLKILEAMSMEPERQWKIKELHAEVRESIRSEATVRKKLRNLSRQGYVALEQEENRARSYLYQLTSRATELQAELDIRILDERSWLLDLYDRLSKGEDPQKLREEYLTRFQAQPEEKPPSPDASHASDASHNTLETRKDVDENLQTSNPNEKRVNRDKRKPSWLEEATHQAENHADGNKTQSDGADEGA